MMDRYYYSNDRSSDNLILILMHTIMDLKSLSQQDQFTRNTLRHIIKKYRCLNDVLNAFFTDTLFLEEWDSDHFRKLFTTVPSREWVIFKKTLSLAIDIYHRAKSTSNVSDEDVKMLENYFFECTSTVWCGVVGGGSFYDKYLEKKVNKSKK